MSLWSGFLVGVVTTGALLLALDKQLHRTEITSAIAPDIQLHRTEITTAIAPDNQLTISSVQLPFAVPSAESAPEALKTEVVETEVVETAKLPQTPTAPTKLISANLAQPIVSIPQVEQPVVAQQELIKAEKSTPPADTENLAATQWHPIWKSFRGELSANGFADYLSRLTGENFRVNRMHAWAYQVELAYQSDEQRKRTLQLLEQKTGVRMFEPQP